MHAPTTTTEITTGPTAPPSVPSPERRSRATRYWAALFVSVGVFGAAIGAAALVTTPYATLSPGSARVTEPLLTVDGRETFASEGEILFLTVGVDDEVTLLEAAAGWIDPDVDVLQRDVVIPPELSPEENRAQNAQLMTESKSTAVVVALGRLGIPVELTGTGVVVRDVEPGTPADGALQVSDTIVAVDGAPITVAEELIAELLARRPGDEVTLTVETVDRPGEASEVVVTLAARPDDPNAGFLGISTGTRDPDPGVVQIDSGRVGGPSAGLAFTLAVLDVLTEGDLTGGRHVAVTGTILPDGSVGPVGGVAQKAAAASSAGAEVMLVPVEELEEARARDHGLEIVGVATLDDALAALERVGGDPLP